MERWQILLIVAVASLAWYLYRRFVKKGPLRRQWYSPPLPEVENWYQASLVKIEALDEKRREEREASWQAMSEKERMEFSDSFILKRFGEKAISGYTIKQRLQIGLVHYILQENEE